MSTPYYQRSQYSQPPTKTLPNHRTQPQNSPSEPSSSVPNILLCTATRQITQKVFVSQEHRFLSGMPREDLKFGACQRAVDIQNAPRAVPAGTTRLGLERKDGLHATIEFFFDLRLR
jgi:hypothetical protein